MTILIKTPEGLSDIILNLVIVDVPRHQPDKLVETDLPVAVLVYLADHLLKLTT